MKSPQNLDSFEIVSDESPLEGPGFAVTIRMTGTTAERYLESLRREYAEVSDLEWERAVAGCDHNDENLRMALDKVNKSL